MNETMETESSPTKAMRPPPNVPLDALLWTRDECAAYLRVEPTTMVETVAIPDFPKPTRVTGADSRRGPSNRRWFASDVIEWARGRKG